MKYRPDIDGLRAVAVVPVLFFHAGFGWFPGGFVGVDVFFAISGYLITGLIVGDLAAGRFSLWAFYERRFRRIAPALIAMCFATVPFALLWMIPSELRDYARSLSATAVSASNFYFWQAAGYFAPDAALQPLLHTWSLAAEEQFYVVFPLFLLLLGRYRLSGIIALTFASFLLTQIVPDRDPEANFYLRPTRFWELGLGAIAAIRPLAFPKGLLAEVGAAGGLLLIVLSIFLLDGSEPYPGWWTLPPVVGTILVLVSGGETRTGRLLAWRPLVGVGLISYSLYLWHQPLFAFARIRLLGDVTPAVYAVLIVAALGIAYASWRWIEQPFRDRGRFTRSQIFAGTIAASAFLLALGVAGDRTKGLPQRAGGEWARLFAHRPPHNAGLGDVCSGRMPLPARCRTSDEPEMVVLGDSYAMHLVVGIVASHPSVRLAQLTMSACGPLFGIAQLSATRGRTWARKCLAFQEAAKAYIAATPSIRYAVVSSPFVAYTADGRVLFDGHGKVPAGVAVARLHLQETLDWLRSRGITPVVFRPPPVDGRNIGICLARAVWLGIAGDRCDLRVTDVGSFNPNVSRLLDGLAVKEVDMGDFLCDDRYCKAHAGDVMIYRDAGHLTYEGSRYIGEHMAFYDRIVGNTSAGMEAATRVAP
jgi:peptidoglycan/LPS O-acetylase OafA/YrhL